MTATINLATEWGRQRLVRAVEGNDVIAYPTEAVWGLGCNPWSEFAVDTILALKQRPMHKGLILVAASVEQVRFLLDPLPSDLRQRAEQHWPGPVTCVVPDPLEQIPRWVRGDHDTIAVRVSAHPLVQRLCILAGMPLVSTSCNPAGREPARAPWQVSRYFPAGIDLMVSGALGGARQPSTIIDITTGETLR
ncbi:MULTISPECIES: L-threonylcarbamoyladenylate synthase [Marinobacter]|uniref:Threonylcarbamoyl-AMP synthase n=1 Tax=Marinobacter segnicrescens TaxID=430453 RepID=A0A1I0DGF2_9GAMM|nr:MULTISPECIES: L-threonylcarbamoyladenylate synthase [Marinobacter]UZD65840.1 L-threonylcarbamoyladenylate synthase [Marinobacter sp. AN1]SET31439.1 L-threonylcarbamoyladenylate synthase [Marinobacter segnicrescens]